MLFLEHAQSDEWDSLLVKNYSLPNVICVAEVELYQRGEPIYVHVIKELSFFSRNGQYHLFS